jgi:protein-disulfide isomerase
MRRLLTGVGIIAIVAAIVFAAPVKSRGSANAPIKMDVYSDFQCPGCRALYFTTLLPLIQNYVDKGKVLLIHHEFPLPIHAHAMEAACYACAANRIGKYDQVCDVLFRKQDDWAASGKVDETVCSVLSADDARKVRALAKDQSVIAEVQADIQSGRAAQVDGTPTVFLTRGGKTYRIPSGAGYDILRRFIDQLLAN